MGSTPGVNLLKLFWSKWFPGTQLQLDSTPLMSGSVVECSTTVLPLLAYYLSNILSHHNLEVIIENMWFYVDYLPDKNKMGILNIPEPNLGI